MVDKEMVTALANISMEVWSIDNSINRQLSAMLYGILFGIKGKDYQVDTFLKPLISGI